MKTQIRTAAFAALAAVAVPLALAAPAAADDDGCNVPREQWQPEAALRQQLEGQGWQIRRVKVDDGCYEVYATDKDGRRREVYFDPQSLQPVYDD